MLRRLKNKMVERAKRRQALFKPKDFPESTMTLSPPKDWDDEKDGKCGVLAVCQFDALGGEPCQPQSVSRWTLSGFWNRVAFLLTGEVWLHVVGRGHPPVSITLHKPIKREV